MAAEGVASGATVSAGARAGTAGVSGGEGGAASERSSRAGEGGGTAGFSGAATTSSGGAARFVATGVRVLAYRTSPAPGEGERAAGAGTVRLGRRLAGLRCELDLESLARVALNVPSREPGQPRQQDDQKRGVDEDRNRERHPDGRISTTPVARSSVPGIHRLFDLVIERPMRGAAMDEEASAPGAASGNANIEDVAQSRSWRRAHWRAREARRRRAEPAGSRRPSPVQESLRERLILRISTRRVRRTWWTSRRRTSPGGSLAPGAGS